MNEHTPGPWTLADGNCGAMIGVKAAGRAVCIVGHRDVVNAADAQLIAAAPEMYEALKAIRAFRETPIVDDEFPEMRDRADRLLATALAKAEGEPRCP